MKQAMILFFMLIPALLFGGDPEDSIQTTKRSVHPWLSPHYIPVQYAGNIGFLSAGVGYRARTDNYQLSLVYGYAPSSVSGVPVHLVTARNIFHLYKFPIDERQMLIPYAAAGLSVEVGGRSFFKVPSNMPEQYYHFPKSVHLIPAAGVKWRRTGGLLKYFYGIEFFAEVSTVDAWIFYKLYSDDVSTNRILTSSFGVHLLRR